MPTLNELKAKWFIPMDGSSPNGVPCRRHSEIVGAEALSVSTDGNIVTAMLDGQDYMRRWHDELFGLHSLPGAELFHAGWRFEGVKTLGATAAGNDALEDVNDADSASVTTFVLTCRNVFTMVFNNASVIWLRAHNIWTSCMDNRFPAKGSNHFKFAVMKHATNALAVVGSVDISKSRWDTSAHLSVNADRNPLFGKQTHDTGVTIVGPAVADVEKTYRERWNDSSRTFGLEPLLPPQPLITSPIASPPAVGSHSVQALRTYGITYPLFGYSWADRGEFTVWASYLNAIKRAAVYIYIEDQYFLPFDWPPCHTRTGTMACLTDIIYQLGEAMKRGVNVAVLTPSNAEDSTHVYQKYQRDIGVNYLLGVRAAGAPGNVVVASLENVTDVYVHSKLLIIDDEFVAIGCANVGQRSMAHDGELQVGIVDAANTFAKEFRKMLWAEHSGRAPASLDDPVAAYALFQTDVTARAGHLKPYPVDLLNVYPAAPGSNPPPTSLLGPHTRAIRLTVDPYAGPPGLR